MKEFQALDKYLPAGALPGIQALLRPHSVKLRITRPRKSKRGDYRPLVNCTHQHQITINNDLNEYAFLITLVHEIAHMEVYARYAPRRVQPHGKEWKITYTKLLRPFIEGAFFPKDVEQVLRVHLESPKASSCTDHNLFAVLCAYDENAKHTLTVTDISTGENFRWRDGRVFKRGDRLRTRYMCTEVKTGRAYRFHPLAEVERLDV